MAPLETKVYELIMADVWMVPQEKIDGLRKQTSAALEHLKDTAYFTQGDLVAKTIYGRLDEIVKTQDDLTISRQQHIACYRDNLKTLDSIKSDLDKLEKLLVAVGGPPNLELVEESDVNLKSPSSKTTWIIIFLAILFIAILSVTFYLTWMRQASVTENIFQKEKTSSFSEFKNPSGESPPEKKN